MYWSRIWSSRSQVASSTRWFLQRTFTKDIVLLRSSFFLYPESALAAPHRITHPSAQSLVSPTHVRDLEYTCVAWRCGTHYRVKRAPPVSLIYKPLDLPSQQSPKVQCSEDLASLASQNVPRPSKERASRILDLQPQTQNPFFACLHSSFAYPELLSTWHV